MAKAKSIHSSLFYSYSLFIIVIMLFVVLFFYFYTSTIMTKTAFSSIEENCSTTTLQVDAEINRMNTISLNISYSNLIKEEFTTYSTNVNEQTIRENIETLDYMYNILIALIGPNLTVSQINLYDFNRHMLASGAINSTFNIDASKQSWYEGTIENKGFKYLSLPYTQTPLFENISPYYKDYYISLTRIYYDKFRAPKGIVEILQPCSKIFTSADALILNTDQPKNVYLYNEQGIQIYPYKASNPGENYDYFSYVSEKNDLLKSYMIENTTSHEEQLICYTTSKETGWTTMVVIDKKVLLKPIYSFGLLLILFFILVIALSLVLSYFLAKRITEPISRLKSLVKNMNTVEELSSPTLVTLDSNINELEELYTTVSNMSTELNHSITEVILSHTQETQAKFLALQSQMNPHFIYNTITNISILAEENKTEEAVKMCEYVSNMLRYVTTDQRYVSLHNELTYTEEYLNCMKIRYGNDIIFETDMDENLYNIRIPKLILQPMVENSLKYGIEVDPPWIIKLCGRVMKDKWTIEISDNGNGYTDEALTKLQKQISEIDHSNHLPSLSLNGMGILNIYIRLKLYYGDQLIFKLSNINGGATILLGGPLEGKGIVHDDTV